MPRRQYESFVQRIRYNYILIITVTVNENKNKPADTAVLGLWERLRDNKLKDSLKQ